MSVHKTSAISRNQRIRSEASEILAKTAAFKSTKESISSSKFSNAFGRGRAKRRSSDHLAGVVTDVEGKHDIKETRQSIKSSQSRQDMRKSMDNLFSKIKRVENPSIKTSTPKTIEEALQLLKLRVSDPSCLASIDIIESELERSNNAEHKIALDLHLSNDELTALKGRLNDVQKELVAARSDLQAVQTKYTKDSATYEVNSNKMRSLEASETKMQNDLMESRSQIRKLQEENDSLRHEVRSKKIESAADLEKAKAELAWANNELNAVKQKYSHATQSLENLQASIDDKASASQTVYQKFKDQNQALRKELADLREKNELNKDLAIEVQSLKEHIKYLENNSAATQQEERMAHIISWLLELQSASFDENWTMSKQSSGLDKTSIQMLNELRQIYDQEMSNVFANGVVKH